MEIKDLEYEKLGVKACDSLRKNGFDALYVPRMDGAIAKIQEFVEEGASVGLGGSVTLAEFGVRDLVASMGARILDISQPGLTGEEMAAIMRAQLTSDLFITGANAVTLDGSILNVDMTGNRTGAMTFGPKKVLIVAGANKIVPTEEDAFNRIKTIAAPRNAKRLGMKTPCVVNGVCSDCNSPSRICRAYQLLRKKPGMTDITVIIVGTEAGL